MNWIKENKFVFGFIVVVAIGGGVLTWFVLGAKGRYDDSVAEYESKVGELGRLQRLPIFPNQKNLDRILAQQNDVNTEVSALAADLASQQIPTEDLSPEQFQDRLKASVTAVRTKAAQSIPAVALPKENFFLAMQRYETAPPAREAASALGRELKALEWLTTLLIESKVSSIESLDREELPEEAGRVKAKTGKPATPAPVKSTPGKPGKPEKAATNHAVEKHRIQVAFTAEQSRLRQVLNGVVNYKGQFFIPRLISVKNTKTEAPKRGVTSDPNAPVAPPDPNNPTAAAPVQPSSFIVGEEKVNVTLVLEMVDFTEEAPTK